MPDRETLLRNIKAGDIFHAESPHGASLVCLATAINETAILSRRFFVEEYLEFDRTTGVADSNGIPCTIDSVVALPLDVRQVLEGLDHRNRTSTKPGNSKFTDAEKRALLFIADYYRANQI